jgi:hypothetical protein
VVLVPIFTPFPIFSKADCYSAKQIENLIVYVRNQHKFVHVENRQAATIARSQDRPKNSQSPGIRVLYSGVRVPFLASVPLASESGSLHKYTTTVNPFSQKK